MSERSNKTFGVAWESTADVQTPDVTFAPSSGFKAESNSPKPVSSSADGRAKVELAKELVEKGYHPILIFGTRASGKTSLLASLFHLQQSDPTFPAILVQGDWIVPIDTTYGATVSEAASRFLGHVVNNFYDGEAAPSTRDEYPFYIPVILRPNNGQPEVRLAFLESRGEWYHINKNSQDLFPQLREEISDVYQNFPNGISILLVAPYVIGDAYTEGSPSEISVKEMRESDTGLFSALQSYQMSRQHRDLDRYLFILTKWDAHTRSIVDKDFINPPRGMVSYLISERFPKSWTLFQNMQSGEAQSMQYSSGLMSGNARAEVPEHLRPNMYKFPQMLWRWLYANATYGSELFLDHPSSKAENKPSRGLLGTFRKLLG
jgi:hypothetical protein